MKCVITKRLKLRSRQRKQVTWFSVHFHTLDATETINRIIAVFPPHQQKQIRLQLAQVLKAVVSLRFMPKADGQGRVPATEVLGFNRSDPRLHY